MLVAIKAQNLTKLSLSNPSGGNSYMSSVPGFKADKYDYEVLISNTSKSIPNVIATGDGKIKITQAKSIEGKEIDRTALVIVEKNGTSNTYNILFTKINNLLNGILFEDKDSPFTGDGYYTCDKISHGEIWGDYSYRALSTTNYSPYLTSPILENGAKKLIFWITEDLPESDKSSELLIKITTDGKNWKTIARFPAENLKTGLWEKKEIDINSSSPLTQIQFMIKRSGSQRDIRFDDITITPYQ